MTNKRQSSGFTLVEMLIVVAVLGILTTIAYPAYTHYLERGHLANAQADLVKINLLLKKEQVKNPAVDLDEKFGGLRDDVIDKEVAARYNLKIDVEDRRYRLWAEPTVTGYTLAAWMDSLGNRYRCDNVGDAKAFKSGEGCRKL